MQGSLRVTSPSKITRDRELGQGDNRRGLSFFYLYTPSLRYNKNNTKQQEQQQIY